MPLGFEAGLIPRRMFFIRFILAFDPTSSVSQHASRSAVIVHGAFTARKHDSDLFMNRLDSVIGRRYRRYLGVGGTHDGARAAHCRQKTTNTLVLVDTFVQSTRGFASGFMKVPPTDAIALKRLHLAPEGWHIENWSRACAA